MNKVGRIPLAETANGESKTRLDIVKEWLAENYEVRINLLDRSKISLTATAKCPMTYEFPVTEEDILLHAYSDELPIPRGLLKNLLASPNQMRSFNPVHDYIGSLRGKYKGPSQIDLLCNSLHLVDETARKRRVVVMRKWLVATVACALGIRQNDVALGLVGERAGIGKTTFFEQIVPESLKEYYQVAQKDERVFQMHTAFAQRFLLNFDEFAAITQASEQLFKQLMSAQEVVVRRPGSRYVETVPRVASCCFTSNKTQQMGGFIRTSDEGMLRRLAVIEVDSIDDYRERLDVDQLWAEAVMLLDGGFDPVWSQQEYQNFVTDNRQYVVESKSVRLIRRYFRHPGNDEKPVFLSASDIICQMREKKLIRASDEGISEKSIGQALTLLGFARHGKWDKDAANSRYGYEVIPLFS